MAVASITQTILDAIDTALQAKLGTGSGATHEIATANFYKRKLPWDVGVNLPGLFMTPVPEIEGKSTNASDDVGYGVQITIVQASNRDLTANADRLYYWREEAMDKFRSKRLAGSGDANIHLVEIETRPVIDPASFARQIDATAFVLRCWTRKTRP
ncbi:MAG: hypothetical protein ACE5EX_11175 [Phycisphaerae bacterium]